MAIVITRTFIVYFALLLTMRLMGKRQLGEMELSEFVVAALIADLAAHPLQDMGIPLLNGLVPIAVLFCCEVLIAGLSLRSIRLRELLFGKPSLLIVKGEIDQAQMRRNRFTLDELMQELRSQGVTDIRTIEYAVLETDGKLSLLRSPAASPVTASRHLGLDTAWLDNTLHEQGYASPAEVYLMTVDEGKAFFLARKEATIA